MEKERVQAKLKYWFKDWELYDDTKANLCNMLNPLKEYDQEEIEQEVPKPKGMRM